MQAILGIGGKLLLPERFGNDAEHGSAIEVVEAVGNDGEFEIAKRSAMQRGAPVVVRTKVR